MNSRVALWLRVSDPNKQTDENQLAPLEAEAVRRCLEVSKIYSVGESAYKGAQQKALSELYKDARLGVFAVLIVFALDRLNREGALATLETWHRLANLGVTVVSLTEPWVETSSDFKDVLLAITGWVANMESKRKSDRTKAGLERARAEGKQLGRPKGSKDKKRRRRSGYFSRYAE